MDSEKIIINYSAIGSRLGIFGTIKLFLFEIYSSRFVIWYLFKRDFVAQFRQKILGYFWIVIAPFMAVLPFIFLHRVGIFNPGSLDMPYPVFIVMGLGIWNLLTSSFSIVSSGLQNNEDLIKRTNIPKITFAITGMANILYNSCVHCIVIFVFALILGVTPSAWAILYPFTLFAIIIFGFGLGLLFSVIGTIARDLSNMVLSFLNLVMFISPVVYKPNFNNQFLDAVIFWNPFTYLVELPRSVFVLGDWSMVKGFLLALIFAFGLVLLGLYSFYLIKDSVAHQL